MARQREEKVVNRVYMLSVYTSVCQSCVVVAVLKPTSFPDKPKSTSQGKKKV